MSKFITYKDNKVNFKLNGVDIPISVGSMRTQSNYTGNVAGTPGVTITQGVVNAKGDQIVMDKPNPFVNCININWNSGELTNVKNNALTETNKVLTSGDLLTLINDQQKQINTLATMLNNILTNCKLVSNKAVPKSETIKVVNNDSPRNWITKVNSHESNLNIDVNLFNTNGEPKEGNFTWKQVDTGNGEMGAIQLLRTGSSSTIKPNTNYSSAAKDYYFKVSPGTTEIPTGVVRPIKVLFKNSETNEEKVFNMELQNTTRNPEPETKPTVQP